VYDIGSDQGLSYVASELLEGGTLRDALAQRAIRADGVEQILRRTKRYEFRSVPTNIRGHVWVYASLRPADDPSAWKKTWKTAAELPAGVIVGSVEIDDCRKLGLRSYAYALKNPKRLGRPRLPKNQPQPVFWRPKF